MSARERGLTEAQMPPQIGIGIHPAVGNHDQQQDEGGRITE
jgi:hypothetical protein